MNEAIVTIRCSYTQDEITSWPEEVIREYFNNWGIAYSILARVKQRKTKRDYLPAYHNEYPMPIDSVTPPNSSELLGLLK